MINLETLKNIEKNIEFTDRMLTAMAVLVALAGFIALLVVPAIVAATA